MTRLGKIVMPDAGKIKISMYDIIFIFTEKEEYTLYIEL